ncbi:uncharacterized protein LOC144457739 [Phascolarctos cinereus]
MNSPSQSPNPSPAQSPSQSRSGHLPQNPPHATPRGSNQQPNPRTPTQTPPISPSSSRVPPQTPGGPTSPSQPTTRAPSQTTTPAINPSPFQTRPPSRSHSQTPTPPPSKSPSQASQTSANASPSTTVWPTRTQSPLVPSHIAPYVSHLLTSNPYFQPPTVPIPFTPCFPCNYPCPPEKSKPGESLYFPVFPAPPRLPPLKLTYPTTNGLFTPPCSLTHQPALDCFTLTKPYHAPTIIPATFYTPFSRYHPHPRAHRRRHHQSLVPITSSSPPQFSDITYNRSVHFFRENS